MPLTLTVIGYLGAIVAFVFGTLSLACGLYYMAELVEEYTVQTRRIIKGLLVMVAALHVGLLLIDGLPWSRVLFSLGCHAVYSLNLGNFPYINLTSLPFLASCILVLADHFIWFQFFTRHYHSFVNIASFFGICVWLVPFVFFISLSANDNALPSFGGSAKSKSDSEKQKKSGILKSLFDYVLRKDTTPSLVQAPTYSGFGSSSLSAGSVHSTPSASAGAGISSYRSQSPLPSAPAIGGSPALGASALPRSDYGNGDSQIYRHGANNSRPGSRSQSPMPPTTLMGSVHNSPYSTTSNIQKRPQGFTVPQDQQYNSSYSSTFTTY